MAGDRMSRREARLVAEDVVRRFQELGPAVIEERFPGIRETNIETWFEDDIDPRSGKDYSVGITISRPERAAPWGVMAMVTAPWSDAAAEASSGARRIMALGHWVIPVIKRGMIG
jgi:hypothetical protein